VSQGAKVTGRAPVLLSVLTGQGGRLDGLGDLGVAVENVVEPDAFVVCVEGEAPRRLSPLPTKTRHPEFRA
jgi:hypothetical protein